ncbi:hypothetical protein VHEMI05553 [[Torrubiella] hemipterigena]|uniref:Fungal lipase-type domain-containing protein n=1 Tax=[Torrubiella] hemipterigena TaxID=1531966 RepID=A0A0A1THD5_9HYPO|nr:hypothetical protein VHEMI05553 [[Torrubiella] hemipterigena]
MLVASVLSLAAVAAAGPLNVLEKYSETLSLQARDSISQGDFNNFKFYVEHASAAYCNPDVIPGASIACSGQCNTVQRNGVKAIDSVQGSATGIAAYIARDDVRREIVVSVRGSNNIRNFITDVIFKKQSCDLVTDCLLHTGFATAWGEIKDTVYSAIHEGLTLYKDYRVVLTGHSLGGAVAILGGAYLRRDGQPVDVYTYGAPRVGNDAFANFASNQAGTSFRITHTVDPVPRLPPIIFGFRHTTPEVWLSNGKDNNQNFKISDLKLCPGIANTKCNAGTFGLDIIAHLHYMSDTAGCAPFPPKWKRETDQEVEARLNDWSKKDQAYTA